MAQGFAKTTRCQLAIVMCSLLGSSSALAQGCVIARGGASSAYQSNDSLLEEGHWQVGVAYRWFRSHRHFIGHVEETQREGDGTEVVNREHFLDLNLTYAATNRLWLNLTVPYLAADRSSLYEHDRVHRYHTQSTGLADVRLVTTWWLQDPRTATHGNWSIGLGIKAPTGDYENTDTFIRPSGPARRYVDSSIQPGDGGWGAIVETQGFLPLTGSWSGYFNGSYLINPAERNRTTNFSVPDSHLARLGVDYAMSSAPGLTLSLGGRVEGVPPQDLIGGNGGSRRPGYAISLEPGLQYSNTHWSAGLSVPIAMDRSRQRTYRAATVGDAAFADYSINLNISRRY
ncbi:MAG: hypothetical protein ABI411_11800 [Tahibacter sp.]